jgi:hypothetical protein
MLGLTRLTNKSVCGVSEHSNASPNVRVWRETTGHLPAPMLQREAAFGPYEYDRLNGYDVGS